jgi:hypothetical protein
MLSIYFFLLRRIRILVFFLSRFYKFKMPLFTVYFTTLFVAQTTEFSYRMVRKWWIGKDAKWTMVSSWYCDMSTHCWVAQLVSRHRPVNKISAQTRWRHATALEYGSYATCRDDVTRNRSRGVSRNLRVSTSDATQLSPGLLLRYGS